MKKALLITMLLVGLVGAVRADDIWKQIIITCNTNIAVSEAIDNTEEGYVSAMLFTYESSGTYTVSVDIVKGSVTNRVLSEAITAGTSGLWLPESRLWVANGDITRATCTSASAGNICTVDMQIAR